MGRKWIERATSIVCPSSLVMAQSRTGIEVRASGWFILLGGCFGVSLVGFVFIDIVQPCKIKRAAENDGRTCTDYRQPRPSLISSQWNGCNHLAPGVKASGLVDKIAGRKTMAKRSASTLLCRIGAVS